MKIGKLVCKKPIALLVIVALAIAVIMVRPGSASASFSSSASASYQTTWWNGDNPEFVAFDDDCANYVSQTLFAGGENETSAWYNHIGDMEVTPDWDNAQDLFYYVWEDSGWGNYSDILFAYWWGGTAPATNGTVNGDPYFYNWSAETNGEGYGGIDHSTVQHSIGTDGGGYYGDLISSHTNDRANLFWTEKDASNPANSYWETEEVFGETITN
ncbi:MAG: amidase domain-containing protein [Acidimicrobiales bacterium]